MKKLLISLVVVVTVLLGIFAWDTYITRSAKGKLFDEITEIPHRKAGLVLGTSPVSYWNGRKNYYFVYRMQAAARLYKAGKVDKLIVSGGDYRETEKNGYDEPKEMRDALMKLGVPRSKIIMDYDGQRTINSISNLKEKYGYESITIISQKFHNERALFQARRKGIDAIAYNARTPENTKSWRRNRGREVLARFKMFFEII